MATLDSLKDALRQQANSKASFQRREELSERQYSNGFDILREDATRNTYEDFIIPQLSQLVSLLLESRTQIAVLEVGPGPQCVFEDLPKCMRSKIRRYTAFEPNKLFCTKLEERLCPDVRKDPPFPCLETRASLIQDPFTIPESNTSAKDHDESYDIVLFCHSMYGMKPKYRFVEQALTLLVERPMGGIVAVFHRESLHLDGLVSYRTTSFPTGVVRVANDDDNLDRFSAFIAGYSLQATDTRHDMKNEWREVCRSLGQHEDDHPRRLLFRSPEIMMAFTGQSAGLPALTAHVSRVTEGRAFKNREARLHRGAPIVKPTNVQEVQQCVRWALNQKCSLTVLGGGHSGHCLWPNVVSVDMAAFNQVHMISKEVEPGCPDRVSSSLIVAGTGCTTGDIVRKSMAAGWTVPLGSRPSVGAGLWLQGGISHLSRMYGLACDAIVGAVLVGVASGQILCVGHVPHECLPVDAVRPSNEAELLWAIKGAGTSFGIVVSVVFEAYTAPCFSVRRWVKPLGDNTVAQTTIREFDNVAKKLDKESSADAYLFRDTSNLQLGITTFESSMPASTYGTSKLTGLNAIWGLEDESVVVDCIGLFETDMYVSKMHGGHGAGKTHSFKRCLFLKHLGESNLADRLVAAVNSAPSRLCYLHLLHGGGAIRDVAPNASAFGCRDWEFACVVTGVWNREGCDPGSAHSVIRWVYRVVKELLPLSSGVYNADLGPDPRDAALACATFGPNKSRLARLKRSLDPSSVLAYTCPLLQAASHPKLIILVTGECGAGKDYCADVWASIFSQYPRISLTARVVSISEAIKREYAAASGADLRRLLEDRTYKEQHRPALSSFFQEQALERPNLLTDNFLSVVHGAVNVDVLLVTGMRDDAPVASFSHLVPDSRVIEVQVRASVDVIRRIRRGCEGNDEAADTESHTITMDYQPDLIFVNDTSGATAAESFAERHLIPFFDDDLQRLDNMISLVPDFPKPGVQLRHVLGVAQQPGGLGLCTSLLRGRYNGTWTNVDAVACCEAGGFIFASALALQADVPLALIREAGKLPPPTISATKHASYISSVASSAPVEKQFEMEKDAISKGASVVVIDDVLSTGKTLCAMLEILREAGADLEKMQVMVLLEFPVHRGRERLRRWGFGRVRVQSLLVYGGT